LSKIIIQIKNISVEKAQKQAIALKPHNKNKATVDKP